MSRWCPNLGNIMPPAVFSEAEPEIANAVRKLHLAENNFDVLEWGSKDIDLLKLSKTIADYVSCLDTFKTLFFEIIQHKIEDPDKLKNMKSLFDRHKKRVIILYKKDKNNNFLNLLPSLKSFTDLLHNCLLNAFDGCPEWQYRDYRKYLKIELLKLIEVMPEPEELEIEEELEIPQTAVDKTLRVLQESDRDLSLIEVAERREINSRNIWNHLKALMKQKKAKRVQRGKTYFYSTSK